MQPSPTIALEEGLRALCRSHSRVEFWIEFINSFAIQRVAEIGVYRGDFASAILQGCNSLSTYYMIDPWRHLQNWNKPSNHEDGVLQEFFRETKEKTEFASAKRVILPGTTTEVIGQIPDGKLDFAYVDGDHTLRGIAIDLIRVYPKVRDGGFIGGDDFTSSIWEHKTAFEPTFVFPFSVYFAEAVGAVIYALPFSQFCLHKARDGRFAFVDLTGDYSDTSIRNQVAPEKLLKISATERFPRLMSLLRNAKNLVPKRRPQSGS